MAEKITNKFAGEYGLDLASLKDKLLSLRKTQTFSDAVIRFRGKEFTCHRCILSISSPYLTTKLIDAGTMDLTNSLTYASVDILEKVLDFMYCGCVLIDDDSVESLLTTAVELHMIDLVDIILNFVQATVIQENCLRIYKLLYKVIRDTRDGCLPQIMQKLLNTGPVVLMVLKKNFDYIIANQCGKLMSMSDLEMLHLINEGVLNDSAFVTRVKLLSGCLGSNQEDTWEVSTFIILFEAILKLLDDREKYTLVTDIYNMTKSMFQSGLNLDQENLLIIEKCEVILHKFDLLDESHTLNVEEDIDYDESVGSVDENNEFETIKDQDGDSSSTLGLHKKYYKEDYLSKRPELVYLSERQKRKRWVKTDIGGRNEINVKSESEKGMALEMAVGNINMEDTVCTEDIGFDIKDHVKLTDQHEVSVNNNLNLTETKQTTVSGHNCLWCHEKFICVKELKQHETEKHNISSNKECLTCGKVFSHRQRLVRHVKAVHAMDKPFICDTCGVAFVVKEYLKNHISARHCGGRKHECNECGKSFLYLNHLKRHVLIHTGERPFKCLQCKQEFARKDRLTRHMAMHNTEEKFTCQICEKGFTRKEKLKKHEELHGVYGMDVVEDTGKKECHICKKSIKSGYMGRHLRVHAGSNVRPSSQSHVCPVCGIIMKRKCYLAAHLRIHTGDKPHTCERCGKDFRTVSHLITHERIHTGERPYSCDQCQLSFMSSSALKRHKITHSRVMSHFCHCGRAFYRSDHLRKHKNKCNLSPEQPAMHIASKQKDRRYN